MEKFIQHITKEAGTKVLKLFGHVGVKYTKAHASDPVTEADLVSHRYLIQEIKKKYPSHRIISEEGEDGNEDSNNVWLIDPLDGTLNFSKKVPFFGVIVCFVKKNIPQMATIALPYFHELVFAKRGKGTYLNGKRVVCSRRKRFTHSIGCVPAGIVQIKRPLILEKVLKAKKHAPFGISALGCKAINTAYVANGRRDWIMLWASDPWERVAIALLLQEAGCRVTDFKGKVWTLKDQKILAANPRLHKELLQILR